MTGQEMPKYLGVKVINAIPCKGYNGKCVNNSDMYPTGAIFEDGYKVVYLDGYTSWSPKDVFEKAYQPLSSNRNSEFLEVNTTNGEWEFLKEDEFSL